MKVVMIGPFGLTVKSTMRERALPMAQALVRKGHQVTLIVPPWDSPHEAGKSWTDDGVQIINAYLPKVRGPLYHLQLTAWLVRTALKFQPEVIHLFKPKAYAGLSHVLLLALRQLHRHRARLVVDEDDWELAWNEISDYGPLQKRFFAWQELWGLKQADCVTVASRALQRLVEDLNIPRYKIYYIPNGTRPFRGPLNVLKTFSAWQEELSTVINPDQVNLKTDFHLTLPQHFSYQPSSADFRGRVRAEYDLFGLPIVLLYTRFFEFQLASLLTVMTKVNQFLPETRWLVVGKGYFKEEVRLESMARSEGLAGKLIFAGWIPQEALPYYFAAANVAVHPYEDTLLNRTKCSIKLLDLLSAGVPVVASKVGQNVEYIVHGKTGLLVPPQDLNAMVEAILLVLTQPDIQRGLGQTATRHVNRMFNWNNLIENVEAAYEGI